jgi:hypothetical protein
MKIEVKIIKENKDGSANAQVNFDKDGLETLIQWGLVAMLTKAVDEYKVRPDDAEVSIQPKSKRTVAKKKPLAKKKRKEEDLDGRC